MGDESATAWEISEDWYIYVDSDSKHCVFAVPKENHVVDLSAAKHYHHGGLLFHSGKRISSLRTLCGCNDTHHIIERIICVERGKNVGLRLLAQFLQSSIL